MLDNYESMMNSLTEVLKSSAPQIMAYVSGVASNVVDIFTALASSVYMLAEKTSCCASCAPWCTRFPAVYCRYRAGNLQLCQQQF